MKALILAAICTGVVTFFQLSAPDKPDFSGIIESEKLNFEIDTLTDEIKNPWSMTFLPNGDMLITDKKGPLRLYSNGELHPDPIKGVPEVSAKGQGGLLDVAVHPNYEENGWIYLSYSGPVQDGEKGSGSNTTFIRGKLKDHTLVEQERIFKASPNYKTNHHFGGRILFDNDGYLFLSVGDRGGRDENQTIKNYRGKVFRLYDDGRIPEDNPFVGQAGAVEATFSYGHRNPQGLALHPETGQVWEHEHGPKGGDEINLLQAGNNYGWPTITYGINYNGTIITEDTVKEGMEQPVTFYRPSIAPCGMDFVKGDLYGPWKGNLLVGSLKFQYIKRVELDGAKVTHQETLLEGIGRVRSIKQALDGYIYVVTEGSGLVIRIKPVNG